MRWYVRLKYEEGRYIFIEYSHEKNDTCDGLLKYDKKTEEISIERMSEGADEFDTRWLFGHIHGLIEEDGLTEKKRIIAIG